jgi:hypothetical protein
MSNSIVFYWALIISLGNPVFIRIISIYFDSGLALGILAMYLRHMQQMRVQQRMQEEVRNIFAEYFPVESNDLNQANLMGSNTIYETLV